MPYLESNGRKNNDTSCASEQPTVNNHTLKYFKVNFPIEIAVWFVLFKRIQFSDHGVAVIFQSYGVQVCIC